MSVCDLQLMGIYHEIQMAIHWALTMRDYCKKNLKQNCKFFRSRGRVYKSGSALQWITWLEQFTRFVYL